MPESIPRLEVPASAAAPARQPGQGREEPMDDEEKVLAGRLDANMPALLTRDVKGG